MGKKTETTKTTEQLLEAIRTKRNETIAAVEETEMAIEELADAVALCEKKNALGTEIYSEAAREADRKRGMELQTEIESHRSRLRGLDDAEVDLIPQLGQQQRDVLDKEQSLIVQEAEKELAAHAAAVKALFSSGARLTELYSRFQGLSSQQARAMALIEGVEPERGDDFLPTRFPARRIRYSQFFNQIRQGRSNLVSEPFERFLWIPIAGIPVPWSLESDAEPSPENVYVDPVTERRERQLARA